jgi:hypothetical protein
MMLRTQSREDAQIIRSYLKDSGFVHDTFRESPGLRVVPKDETGLAQALERTAEPSVLNLLVRLFFLGAPHQAQAAAAHLPDPVRDAMERCGMIRWEGQQIVANVMVTPVDDFLFAADSSARMREGRVSDLVLWPNQTTRVLQLFTAETPSGAVLDLGAGCGILGVLAAPRSDFVTATDLNPRAEEFTRFNAWLNDVWNVEALTGDTFDPVGSRKFDLIMANPPFFVTPGSSQMFCENSMELDFYCRRVVREAAQHLNEGGYFQALIEWVQVSGQRWQDRLAEWIDGSGCDVWLVHSYARTAEAYAQERIESQWPAQRSPGALNEWLRYYAERGVEEVHGGVLAMRRRKGRNWLRIDEHAVDGKHGFEDSVMKTFTTQEILSEHLKDEELLAIKPRLPSQVRLERVARPGAGRWTTESLRLRLTGAVPAAMAVDEQVADFLGGCDGMHTLGELVQRLASQVAAAPDTVRAQCCAAVRKLAEHRLLQLER